MIEPRQPESELSRQQALDEYGITDTLPEAEFDDITKIAAAVCGMPISTITIIDKNRQWFKSRVGITITEAPREISFCGHTIINGGEPLLVDDATTDERFWDNPTVTGPEQFHFYAGIPLVNEAGHALGALCVIDHQPNHLTDSQFDTMKALGRQVMALFELRRANIRLLQKQKELKNAYEDLDMFTVIASHDLRSPLNNILSLSSLLNDLYGQRFDEDAREFFSYLKDSANQLLHMVNGILEYSKSSQMLVYNKELVNFPDLLTEIETLVNTPTRAKIIYDRSARYVNVNKTALKQILLNLVGNAIKYNNNENPTVEVTVKENSAEYTFSVKDNGPGVSEEGKEKMFNLFERLKNFNSDKLGFGVGLTIVKRLIEKLDGIINVTSTEGEGMDITFTISKKNIPDQNREAIASPFTLHA